MGTMTIHRCGECNHQSGSHSTAGGWADGSQPRVGPCSMGGCACRLTPSQVTDRYPAVQIPTFAEDDRASWFKSVTR